MKSLPILTAAAWMALLATYVVQAFSVASAKPPSQLVASGPASSVLQAAGGGLLQSAPEAPASPAASPAADNPPADPASLGGRSPADIVKWSRDAVADYSSVRARLVESITMFDRTIKAEGRYLQGNIKADDYRLRLELTLKFDRTIGSLTEVCDGDVLWTRLDVAQETKKDPDIRRRNVKQILDAVREKGKIEPNLVIGDLGLGGVPALLAALQKNMVFQGAKMETLRERPVFVVQGGWNEEWQKRLRGSEKVQDEKAPLPAIVPDRVRLYIDQETGFPIRILFLKRVPKRDILKPMLSLDFFDVVLNQPLNKDEFIFVVPDRVSQQDVTGQYINQLIAAPPPAAPGTPATPGTPAVTPTPAAPK